MQKQDVEGLQIEYIHGFRPQTPTNYSTFTFCLVVLEVQIDPAQQSNIPTPLKNVMCKCKQIACTLEGDSQNINRKRYCSVS